MSLLGDLGTAIKNKLGGTSVDNTVPRYDGTTCKLQGSGVTISDTNVVTASGGFVGSLTGNASTATNVSGGKATVYGTGNDYHLGGVEVVGNGPDNTVFPTIGFHQPVLYASSLQLRGSGDFRFYTQGGASYANVTANTFIGNLSGNANTSGYATTAGRAYPRRSDGADLNFYWSGQGGQPTWLWGGNDGANMYVYNPSNFSVNYATSATYAATAAVGTNDTQIATTEFVNNEIINDVPANIHNATAKTTPADNDELALLDSASSFGLKKFSWLNIKNTIASFLNVQMFSGRMRIGGGADDTVNALQVNGSIYATNHRILQGSFTVYGNQNTFYPVVFDPIGIERDSILEISRFTHTDSSWLGSVRLKIHYGASSWGGYPGFLKPIYCYSNKNTRVANISLSHTSNHLVVWLEGNASGVTYNYEGNNIALRGVYLGGFTDAQGTNFPATTNLSTITTLY